MTGFNIGNLEIVIAICRVNLTEFLTYAISDTLAILGEHEIAIVGGVVQRAYEFIFTANAKRDICFNS